MNGRDWALVSSGAALATMATVGVYEARSRLAGAEPNRQLRVAELRGSAAATTPSTTLDRDHSAATASAMPGPLGSTPTATQVDALKHKLADVQRQRRDLETQLRSAEEELAKRARHGATPERDDLDLTPDDWKQLAVTGGIKYRVPCLLPSDASYTTPPEELEQLGLSPDDGQVLTDAQRRSNARIWATVRPLCAQIVNDEDAVDLLGAQSCISLIERAATKSDPTGTFEARRAVGEVHAGLRAPPPPAEQGPVYRTYMALTSEDDLFQADLAESFGPEDAHRIAQNMRCTSTRK